VIRFLRQHATAFCLAGGTVCLIVVRACVQSITIDEAGSYLLYASRLYRLTQWYSAAGNHVLNSLLMRLVTSVFGVSQLTVRLPAILGGVLYIGSALYLCLLLTRRKLLQLPLLICLTYNPLVLDYLVAARGYGLAIGFLLAAVAIIATIMIADDPEDAAFPAKCVWVSSLLGLSFTANFSFAIVGGILLAAFFLWAAMRRGTNARLALCCFAPAAGVAFLVCGSVLAQFPRSELYFGSQHLSEMWKGLASASFDELNPYVVNPLLIRWMTQINSAIPFAGVVAGLILLARVEFAHWRLHSPRRDGLLDFIRLLVVTSSVTVLIHWIALRAIHLPLPKDRTALFFIPLLTLALGAAAALRFRSGNRDGTGFLGAGFLIVAAVYFLGGLRLGYFKEWKFDAVTKDLYWLADDLHRRCGVTDFGVDWRYNASLNFYREVYHNDSLQEFQGSSSGELPSGKMAYLIFFPTSGDFIEQQRLKITYLDEPSGAVVAIRGCPAGASRN
jgi:hypothetical protein